MNQDWFEMKDVRPVQRSTWIPLRQNERRVLSEQVAGFIELEEFVGFATAAVPIANRTKAEKVGWDGLDLKEHRSGVEKTGYHSADIFEDYRSDGPIGVNLVIAQLIEGEGKSFWHLHPDLIVALGLVNEKDRWFRPEEGWIDVVRLIRNDQDEPVKVEIRAEFLADYLVARGMALYLSSFRSREAVADQAPNFTWPKGELLIENSRERIEARIVSKDTNPFAGAAFIHMGRTNVDVKADAPIVDPRSEDGLVVQRGVIRGSGRQVTEVVGEQWRTEWFEPGNRSLRVRGDSDTSPVTFIVDTDGTREPSESLRKGKIRWLFFKPDLVPALLRYRGSTLAWHTRDTGDVSAGSYGVHFGVNDHGLVNILAKDIDSLPGWEQRVWSAYNVTPEGGVSKELLESQMDANPATTQAPEAMLSDALSELDRVFTAKTGKPLLRAHDSVPELLARSYRFRAAEHDGIYALAKDVTRLFAERISVDPLIALLPKADKKLSSLKALEYVLGLTLPSSGARALMSPFFGIYDLRLTDSHLASSDVEDAMKRANIDTESPPAIQGRQLLESFISTLCEVKKILQKP